MTSELIEYIEKFYAIVLPTITLAASAIGVYWKQKSDIKKLKRQLSALENGLVQQGHNLLLDSVVPNVESAKAKILEIINNSKSNSAKIRIDNIGLDLETVGTLFKYTFSDGSTGQDLEYRGLVIDPDSKRIQDVCTSRSNLSVNVARSAIKSIREISSSGQSNIDIELYSYDLPPVIHGFLINDEHLLIGFTYFDQGGLVGGSTPYLYLQRDRNSKFKESIFQTYRTWFKHLKDTSQHHYHTADSAVA